MKDDEKENLAELIDSWQEPTSGVRRVFLRLRDHLESKDPVRLAFKARPGVSYSLRAATPGQGRELFVMVDVIDDDPQNRWLSVCFYGEMITDPEEMGDLIPGGLLGEDGYCFDVQEDDNAMVTYLLARIDEAHQSALQ
ncbi:MAG: hypothetical protein AB1724_01965 [Thermodesulfobacteriota bacterium]